MVIEKINDYTKKQKRNFALTDSSILNFEGTKLKRRIFINRIYALTLSRSQNEFIVHITDDYDYRYSPKERRNNILEVLNPLWTFLKGMKMRLPVYTVEDSEMQNYMTTKELFKKKQSKAPVGNFATTNEGMPGLLGLYARFRLFPGVGTTIFSTQSKTILPFDFEREQTGIDLNNLKVQRRMGKSLAGSSYLGIVKETGDYIFVKSYRKKEAGFHWTSEEMNGFRNYFLSYVTNIHSYA